LDEELDLYLDLADGNLRMAAGLAYQALAGDKARLARLRKVLHITIDLGQMVDSLLRLSASLIEEAKSSPSLSVVTLEAPGPEEAAEQRTRMDDLDSYWKTILN
jgi:hypothetical protein